MNAQHLAAILHGEAAHFLGDVDAIEPANDEARLTVCVTYDVGIDHGDGGAASGAEEQMLVMDDVWILGRVETSARSTVV